MKGGDGHGRSTGNGTAYCIDGTDDTAEPAGDL